MSPSRRRRQVFYDLRLGKFGMYFKFYGFDGSNSR